MLSAFIVYSLLVKEGHGLLNNVVENQTGGNNRWR